MIPDHQGLFREVTLPVLFDGKWEEKSISELASPEWENRQYQVLAWTGRSFKQVEAHSAVPAGSVNSLVKMELFNKKRLALAVGHQVPELNPRFASEKIPNSVGLLLSKAAELKTGLALVSCSEKGIDHAFHNIAGIQRLSALRIAKLKTQKCEEAEITYTLSVPSYRNVLLSCGIVVTTK